MAAMHFVNFFTINRGHLISQQARSTLSGHYLYAETNSVYRALF